MKILSGRRWPALAVLVSLGMLGAAHLFERVFLLDPCPLCLKQREVYWAVAAMGLTGLVLYTLRPTLRFLPALNILIALVFLVGVVVASFHVGVENGWLAAPSGCAAGASRADIISGPVNLDTPVATASCTDVAWQFLGLSMAAWNAIISLALAGLSLLAARATANLP